MRAPQNVVYRMHTPGPVPAVFEALMRLGPVSLKEAYATFNMGAGFAIYVRAPEVDRTLAVARQTGYSAWVAGDVVDGGGRKAVEIPPLGITFEAESLAVR
jgi:phosphoribosylformylglycinamidine cyclo-ligase